MNNDKGGFVGKVFPDWFREDLKPDNQGRELTEDQAKWVKRWTFGAYLWDIYSIFRRNWDFLIILVCVNAMKIPAMIYKTSSAASALSFISSMIAILFLIVYCAIGRRLSWNRNDWESFEAFKRSDTLWHKWAWGYLIFILALIVLLIGFAFSMLAFLR